MKKDAANWVFLTCFAISQLALVTFCFVKNTNHGLTSDSIIRHIILHDIIYYSMRQISNISQVYVFLRRELVILQGMLLSSFYIQICFDFIIYLISLSNRLQSEGNLVAPLTPNKTLIRSGQLFSKRIMCIMLVRASYNLWGF